MWSITKERLKCRSGFTLLEIVFALTLVVFLVSSIMFVYIVLLKSWHNLGNRMDLDEKLHFGLERVVRDVREASAIATSALPNRNHALRLTVGGSSFVYYLHNALDCPPAFTQTSYDLRRASFTGGVLNDFTNHDYACGSGEIFATSLTPPPAGTTITSTGNRATLQLTGLEDNETAKVRSVVLARNA